MTFDKLHYDIDENGELSKPEIIEEIFLPCDDVILAIGQDNAFPWIERDLGLGFDKYDTPAVDEKTHGVELPGIFFGGDSAFGPKNIIWAVEHGPTKMGIHEWSYSNDYDNSARRQMRHVELTERFKNIRIEVELGFDPEQTASEVERCLNCDVQTVFSAKDCIECDACMDVCPVYCLCAERCPTGAWDMRKSELIVPYANSAKANAS